MARRPAVEYGQRQPGARPAGRRARPMTARADNRGMNTLNQLVPFLVHWGITALSLWVASHLFKGLKFDRFHSLAISALLLGFANAIIKPLLIVLTLPLTLLTFGVFVLVINALMVLLVARLVRGFTVSGFWTAFFAGMFISVLSIVIGAFVTDGSPSTTIQMPHSGVWL
jgi:putative membrane protein